MKEKLSDWENAALHVEADHHNEVHCGCVPILRKLLTDAINERNKAFDQCDMLLDVMGVVDEVLEMVEDKWHGSHIDGITEARRIIAGAKEEILLDDDP